MKLDLLDRFTILGEAGAAVALVTMLATGEQAVCTASGSEGALGVSGQLRERVTEMLAQDRAGIVVVEDLEYFVETWVAPMRLIVVGGVHVAQALVPMAHVAGYQVTLVEPRSAFGTPERFPGVAITDDWPDDAVRSLKPDRRTAIVTLSHDPKLDDPALMAALRSEAFYVGALGSRRSHAKRLERLAAAGFGEAEIDRIRGPVGLAIGAVSPGEIAISILSEITAVRRGKTGVLPVR